MLLYLPIALPTPLAAVVAATPTDTNRLHGTEPGPTAHKHGPTLALKESRKERESFASLFAENRTDGVSEGYVT